MLVYVCCTTNNYRNELRARFFSDTAASNI
jgi:hypothetical protein